MANFSFYRNLYRWEILECMKKNIRKRLTKTFFPLKVWLHGVEKKKIRFNPRAYDENEKFFEQLLIWKKVNLKKYLTKYPQLTLKAKRHKKVCEYRKPIGV